MSPGKRVGGALFNGTKITVVCETEGEPVNNGSATISIWEKTDEGTYFPNAYVYTGHDGWTPGMPKCGEPPGDQAVAKYDRDVAVAWAIDNVYARPAYEEDCTFFVSQALWFGHVTPTSDWEPSSQFSSDTRAALIADEFKNYLQRNSIIDDVRDVTGEQGPSIPGAELGDIVGYDWDADGFMDHVAIVTSTIGDATLVTAHTNARLHARWDLGRGSRPEIRYYLMHIIY